MKTEVYCINKSAKENGVVVLLLSVNLFNNELIYKKSMYVYEYKASKTYVYMFPKYDGNFPATTETYG